MAGTADFFETAIAQQLNNMLVQSNAANQMFISVMANNMAVHSRCGQVIDKRVAEFDIEENRAYTSVDPTTQAFLLARAGQDNGATMNQNATLLEILRQVQARK
jgi:hypothetical protein